MLTEDLSGRSGCVYHMSDCRGDIAIGAKVDTPMRQFIDAEAEQCGVTRAELLRRILDDFRESRREQMSCPECDQTIVLDPCPSESQKT